VSACGIAHGPPHQTVRVSAAMKQRVIATRQVSSGKAYTLRLSPGTYRVQSDQIGTMPVEVTLRSGQTVEEDFFSSCS
jgi:hypothetical protein